MLKSLGTAIVLAALFLPMVGDRNSPAWSQERQGCFMVDETGRFIDLSDICPTPAPFAGSGSPTTAVDAEGLGTGDIQVTLRWASTDDLDLYVTDPNGQTVYFGNRQIPSGGQLDVDANAACSGSTQTPIENVFWPAGQAPQGNYTVEVDLWSRCSGGTPGEIPFEIRLLVQGQTQTINGSVGGANSQTTFPFSLPLQ
jgi:hypothetical protein